MRHSPFTVIYYACVLYPAPLRDCLITHALAPYGIEAQHPDEFIENLFDLDAASVLTAVRKQRATLSNPAVDVDSFLETLLRQGLVQTTKTLSLYKAML